MHTATYIRSLALRFDFVERVAQEVTVRFEKGAAVAGRLFVLRALNPLMSSHQDAGDAMNVPN